jgi:hypothetical protein
MQIGAVNSCYVVPHKGGRDRLQQARASAEYHGRRVNNDLAKPSSKGEPWYAKAYLFFKATERTNVWNHRIRAFAWSGDAKKLSSNDSFEKNVAKYSKLGQNGRFLLRWVGLGTL